MLTERGRLNQTGTSLAELLIAVALIGVGILGSVASFNVIQRSIQNSKSRTIATMLAQEKMQILMQKPYFEVLVTTAPRYDTRVSPSIAYDGGYYTPETLTEGGINFTRLTHIQVVQENPPYIEILPPTTPDTGMRQITVSVVWTQGNEVKYHSLQSVVNNPNTVMANAIIRGRVTDANTGNAINSALVNVAENVGWRDSSNSTGNYTINLVAPGTFGLLATAPGYFPNLVTAFSVAPHALPYTQDFALIPIGSGTLQGTAWLDDHLVISQIVSSTGPADGIEYVELYNPTSQAVNMGTNALYSTPPTWAIAWDAAGTIQQRQLVYISTYVPTHGFYLITNTGDGAGASAAIHCDPITINGSTVNPDACWRFVGGTAPNYSHTLQCNPLVPSGCAPSQNAGGFGIGRNDGTIWSGLGSITKYDAIAWNGTGTPPIDPTETSPANPSTAFGMAPGEAFIRRLDTTTAWSGLYGNAYDTDSNSRDFISHTLIPLTPRTSSTSLTPKSGTPAQGAIVSVSDGISTPVQATLSGEPPYASFSVPGVASGSWVVFIDSSVMSGERDAVTILQNTVTWLPDVILDRPGYTGTISGRVTDAFGGVISPAITVAVGSNNTTVGASGNYMIRLPTGTFVVTANPSNVNAAYESQTITDVNVSLGDVTASVNFMLSQGGKISGWVSRDGLNPLPGVSVTAEDSNGVVQDTQVSDTSGNFLLVNLSTGAFTVRPVLDTRETSTPTNSVVTVTAGNTVSAGTFTVSGAMGYLAGTVSASGQPIQTGVLIVVSTQTISAPPPAISSTTLTGTAYYADSSREGGTYSMEVRGSSVTLYNAAAFYFQLTGGAPVISTATFSNITINAGAITTRNFSW